MWMEFEVSGIFGYSRTRLTPATCSFCCDGLRGMVSEKRTRWPFPPCFQSGSRLYSDISSQMEALFFDAVYDHSCRTFNKSASRHRTETRRQILYCRLPSLQRVAHPSCLNNSPDHTHLRESQARHAFLRSPI